MRNRHSRPTKTLPVVEALKALPVDRAVLLVGPRDPLVDRAAHLVGLAALPVDRADHLGGLAALPVDRAAHLVDPRGHLGAQAVLLAGPGDHPAKKSSEPDPPPAREQPQVQANGESLFTEMPRKGSSRKALGSS